MSDYISREAVLKSIFNEKWDIIRTSNLNDYMKGRAYGFDQAFSVVENMPAADVQPVVHGRWEYTTETMFGSPYGSFKCSVCGRLEPSDEEPYCHCGARMDAEVEE